MLNIFPMIFRAHGSWPMAKRGPRPQAGLSPTRLLFEGTSGRSPADLSWNLRPSVFRDLEFPQCIVAPRDSKLGLIGPKIRQTN